MIGDAARDSGVVPEQARLVAGVVRDVLGSDLIGAYLHGSAVLGGLRPNSDLDVLAVSRRPTTDAEKRTLIERLTRISRRGDRTRRSVNLELVVQDTVRPWRYPPPMDLQYGDWFGADFDRGELTPWRSPEPDLALVISAVLTADRPILGPPPGEVLDPVPADDVRRAMLDGIPALLGDLDGDEANVTLTFARIWVTLETDRIVPKDVAADRALERVPAEHRPVLERARTIYLEGLGDVWDPDLRARVRPCVEHLHQAIRSAYEEAHRGE
jgi:streptomycin 3"-adenylyltransferase